MVKSKIIKKRDITQLLIKSIKGQQLNEPEIQMMNGGIKGILPVRVDAKSKSFKLFYNTSGLIPMKDYLRMPLNSSSFARILRSIFETLKGMQAMVMKQENLLFDIDRVVVNAMEQRVYFVYIPIRLFESGTSLRNFLLDIIQYGTFDNNEDNSYVKEYIRILNNGLNFSIFELEEYIKKLENNDFGDTKKQVQCAHCNTLLSANTKFCPVCGTKVLEEKKTTDNVYNPLDYVNKQSRVSEELSKEPEMVISATQGLSDETTLLGTTYVEPDYNGTTVLGVRDFFTEHNPHLIRTKSQEKVLIKYSDFRIGKAVDNDYVISDNTNVSRKHANIVVKDECVYIVDVGSLNGIKVNGSSIVPNVEQELHNADVIRIADEEFTFFVEE